MESLKSQPSIGAAVPIRQPLRVPILFGGATFLLAFAYLAWIVSGLPDPYDLKAVKHGPNYSEFYLIFMPLVLPNPVVLSRYNSAVGEILGVPPETIHAFVSP